MLLSKSEILIDKTQREVNETIISIYDGDLEEKREELCKEYSNYQQQLKERREKKWEKFKNSNSAENVRVYVPASKISSVTQTATYLQ